MTSGAFIFYSNLEFNEPKQDLADESALVNVFHQQSIFALKDEAPKANEPLNKIKKMEQTNSLTP